MPNIYQTRSPENLYGAWVPINPSDTTDLTSTTGEVLPVPCSGVYSRSGGVIVCVDRFGNEEAFTCPASGNLPLRVVRIKATGTTATGIRALY